MNWASQEYEIWVFETNPNIQIYLWENWKSVYLPLDKLISNLGLKPFIRSSQSFESQSSWLGFGRMVWSKKNNEKWTKKYRAEEYKNEVIQFFDTEIWAPDWNWVWKNREAPDFFAKVDKKGMIFAIHSEKAIRFSNEIKNFVNQLEAMLRDAKVTKGRRTWGEEIYETGYSNGLSDASSFKLAEQLDS